MFDVWRENGDRIMFGMFYFNFDIVVNFFFIKV